MEQPPSSSVGTTNVSTTSTASSSPKKVKSRPRIRFRLPQLSKVTSTPTNQPLQQDSNKMSPASTSSEEKKDSGDPATTTTVKIQIPSDSSEGSSTPATITTDSLYQKNTLPDSLANAVSDLWNEVTWYPVLLEDTRDTSSSSSSRSKKKMAEQPYRRWMAIQGSVHTQQEGWMPSNNDTNNNNNNNMTTSGSASGGGEQSRPLFRHPGSWAGEPYRAESWTPTVAQIRQALVKSLSSSSSPSSSSPSDSSIFFANIWNHVSLEGWQWNDEDRDEDDEDIGSDSHNKHMQKSPHRKRHRQRSVTVVHERMEPTLDLEPGTSVVRIFLTGSLVPQGTQHEEGNSQQDNVDATDHTDKEEDGNPLDYKHKDDPDEDEDDDKTIPTQGGRRDPDKPPKTIGLGTIKNTDDERLGNMYLRPKRYDRQNNRRPSPRQQHCLPLHQNGLFLLGWNTNQAMTHEISIRKPKRNATEQITIMLTFRHVATWLVETEGRLPRVIGRLNVAAVSPLSTTPTMMTILPSPASSTTVAATLQSEEERQKEFKRLSAAFIEERRQEGLSTEYVYGNGSLLVPQAKTKPCLAKLTPDSILEDGWSVATPTSVNSSSIRLVPSPIHNMHVLDASDHFDYNDDEMKDYHDAEDGNNHDEHHSHNKGALNRNHNNDDDEDGNDKNVILGMDHVVTNFATTGNAMALLVVDLQNDFLGDSPKPEFRRLAKGRTRLLRRIDELATQVREQKGVVVFCRSVYGRWSQSRASKLESKRRSLTSESSGSMSSGNEERGLQSTSSDGSGNSCNEGVDDNSNDKNTSSIQRGKAGTHLSRSSCCFVGTTGSDFVPEAKAMIREDDIVMTKQWYSAFLETSLHFQLQRLGVQSVVVCGVTTNHSVSATVHSAANYGYHVIVSSDGTAQIDPKLQPLTEAKLQRYASILAPQTSLKEYLCPDPVTPRSLVHHGQDRLDFDGWNRLSAVGSGDSFLLPDFFDPDDANTMLKKLRPSKDGELKWKLHIEQGGHAPLLTAYQCARNQVGHAPVFRMAALNDGIQVTNWTPSVNQARSAVEEHSGHSYNWVRILHHGSAKDAVRFRSDACLDMREDAHVAICALGDGLVLELRPKPGVAASIATAQKIYLRHNGIFLLGPETNRLFQYSVRCSRKAQKGKVRISLTFRELVTFSFLDPRTKEKVFYGPGTHYPTLDHYHELSRRHRFWEGAGLVACGASSLALLNSSTSKFADQLALASAPVLGLLAAYQYMNYRRKVKGREDESRLEQTFVRCNWQPLKFPEARRLFLEASDEELFGTKVPVATYVKTS